MKLTKKGGLLSLFLLVFLFSSCKSKLNHSHRVKKICTNLAYTPFNADPRKSTDPVSTTLYLMIYEGLTHLEPDGTISLALADSVEISKDQKTYKFHLRKSQWSDGTHLTAHDFESAWKEALSPGFSSLASHLLFPIKNGEKAKKGLAPLVDVGVRAIDEDTLVIELEKPTPYFMQLTAYPTYFPVPNREKEVKKKKNSLFPLTNGPFKLVSWKNEDKIVLKKNQNFWNARETHIDLIELSVISDESTALQLFEKETLDWVGGLTSSLPIDSIPFLFRKNKIKFRPIAGTNFSVFNTQIFPFNNAHIRKAFAYAINRHLIIEHVTQMFDEVATGIVPSILKPYRANHFFLDGDAERARLHFHQGLKELGIKKEDFPPLIYSYFSNELQRKLALALQAQWETVLGVNISLVSSELKVFLSQLSLKNFQFAQMSWIAQYHDPMSFLERFLNKNTFRNYSSWEHPTYQKLINHSFETTSSEKRSQILEEAERLILEEMPIAPIHHYQALYLENPRLKNVQISPLGHVDFRHADIN